MLTLFWSLFFCASAWTPRNYHIPPISFVPRDNSFAKSTHGLNTQINPLSISSLNLTSAEENDELYEWNLTKAQLDPLTLMLVKYQSEIFTTVSHHFSEFKGWMVSFASKKIDGIGSPQLIVHQHNLENGLSLPHIIFTNNKDSRFYPTLLQFHVFDETASVVFMSSRNTVEIATFTIGSAKILKYGIVLTEKLSSWLGTTEAKQLGDKLYALWIEAGGVWKDAVIDLKSNLIRPSTLPVNISSSSLSCKKFSNDRCFGFLCSVIDESRNTVSYHLFTGLSLPVVLSSSETQKSNLMTIFAYDNQLVLIAGDNTQSTIEYFYEIWDLKGRLTKSRTIFLQAGFETRLRISQDNAGGVYTLLFEGRNDLKNIYIGQLLSPSTSIVRDLIEL